MCSIQLRDESRFLGECEAVFKPTTIEEVKVIVCEAQAKHTPITVLGGKTGIVGGGIPQNGIVISTEKLQSISTVKDYKITVGAGVTLKLLKDVLAKQKTLCFLPNPTEETATIGGLFACNAAGGNAYRNGNVSKHIIAIECVTATGEIWRIERGEYVFDDSGCMLPSGQRLECATSNQLGIIKALMPSKGMDLIDLIAGSEGILVIVTSLTLRLHPKQKKWGIVYFFHNDEDSLKYINFLKEWDKEDPKGILSEGEFFCNKTLAVLNKYKQNMESLRWLPEYPPNVQSALSIIVQDNDEEYLEEALIKHYEAFCDCNGQEENTWVLEGEVEVGKLYAMRHAVPEIMNQMINTTKIGTDFTCTKTPEDYRKEIEKQDLEGYIFGHALANHYHINLLPHSQEQVEKATQLIDQWAHYVKMEGGLLITENGIGKIKVELVQKYLTQNQIENMRCIKSFFDPYKLLGKGTILE